MKRFFIIFAIFLLTGNLSAKADYIATQQFVIDVDTTMTVVISGNLTSSINGLTGDLNTPLNINFNITTNEAVNDVRMKAIVNAQSGGTASGFYCTGSTQTASQPMYLVLAEEDTSDVTLDSILNCKQGSSTPELNPCTFAYPGTVAIDNGGTVQYQANGGDGYFSANIPVGETNLNMTLSTSAKAGTYDASSAHDCADTYQVAIYLDNIPG